MKIIEFNSYEDFKIRALAALREQFALPAGNPHAVILPGGRTPFGLYEELAANPPPIDEDLHVILSDERYVPAASPESNYGRMRPLFVQAGIEPRRIIHPDTDLTIDVCAREYDRRLAAFFERGGEITLALLGIGADGHTASLFTPGDLRNRDNPYAIPTRGPTPPDRISLTGQTLSASDKIIFLCAGAEKSSIVDKIKLAPEQVVAAQAASAVEDSELWFSK